MCVELILVAGILVARLAVHTVTIGHRLRRLVDHTGSDAIAAVGVVAAAAEWRRFRVHRTDGKVLPVRAGHLLGRMNGERHVVRHWRKMHKYRKEVCALLLQSSSGRDCSALFTAAAAALLLLLSRCRCSGSLENPQRTVRFASVVAVHVDSKQNKNTKTE